MRAGLLLRPALITGLLLLAPLAAMQFTDEVNWSLFDFVVMGMLVFACTLAYELLAGQTRKPAHRVAVGLMAGAVFLTVWAELAVGAVSKALAAF